MDTLMAACYSAIGSIKQNNEDNFCFNGRCMPLDNVGMRHPVAEKVTLQQHSFYAVYDGIGGEAYGENAAYVAAQAAKEEMEKASTFIISEMKLVEQLCEAMNVAVVEEQKKRHAPKMGCTMAGILFSEGVVYSVNIGDSKVFRYRTGELLQISHDHIAQGFVSAPRQVLTQYLGLDPENYLILPYISEERYYCGDRYLICTDGVTDLLSVQEIADILSTSNNVCDCASMLVEMTIKAGGDDNTTVIVCFVDKK